MDNCTITFIPGNTQIVVKKGSTIKEAIILAGLGFDFPCGGRGTCKKCRIKILERDHLACQTRVHNDTTVQLNTEKNLVYNILLPTLQRDFILAPLINKIYIEKNHITVISDEDKIIGLEEGNTANKIFGIAFDIGTTNIVGYLMDLYTGKELAVSSSLNPQIKFGADVISRTTYSNQNKDGLKTMQSAVLQEIDKIIGVVIDKSGVSRQDIYSITIVGNTCMHHIFLGLNPQYIATSPYVPFTNSPIELSAKELNLHINVIGRIFVLPNISGFVGADTVGVVLATEMDKGKEIKLAIDIGTNGEIVIGSAKKLVSCSTSAGPAFEGSQISCGMRGAIGAINHVRFEDKLIYTTIGNKKPQGICGSGLLDIIAGLVELGIINKRGRLLSPDKLPSLAAKSYEKYIIDNEGTNAFLLVEKSDTEHGRPIMITQDDISSFQLAKGAISAGINVLIEEYGIIIDDIKEVLLAGAFGNYLDPHSACAVGLIPYKLESKIKMVGNAAGTGSKLALLSRNEYNRSVTIANMINYIELGSYKHFSRKFAEAMQF